MKEFFCFIFSFFVTFFFLFSKEKEEEKNYKKNVIKYIKDHVKFALEEMEKFKIPASIKLGQGILESSSGNSTLAKLTNNHFGIKCGKEWKGDIYYHDDDLPKECFRKYKSVRESFNDHSKFLKKSRYSKLFLLKIKDYQSWAIGLEKAGYATSLNYSDQLISKIEKYSLWIFDEETSQEIEKRIDKHLNKIKMKEKETKKTILKSFFQKIYFLLKRKLTKN
ncbi:glycoside hydrolase family 73 protein [Blattabacterium cuenoti]|uniref:glycoside hydrolase family 73 protein n=1 Tax=Blattabacterium cuenoti TaxID=1653831 RepID=UPI00163C7AE5|nr:glucosaminidase domain-containing protein [Blattabacterium cuenoti]